MLTSSQKKWISHLDTKKVKIVPYNPKVKPIFEKIKREIQEVLGRVEIIHCGSTSLGILGQGEIDLYIPVPGNIFNIHLKKLIEHFGRAGSIYPTKRARFVEYVNSTKVEIFLINREIDDWTNCVKFENYLKKHPESLERYKRLKEKSDGLTVQEYYQRKLEFFNQIINLS